MMGGLGRSFKKNLILALTAAILGGVGVGTWQFFQFNDGRLHLVFCDVGQGDAIYLKTPSGQEVLIDGGPDEKVLDCLSSRRPFYDRKIEVLILTHPQADHLTGLIAVLERYKVDYLIAENIFSDSAVFARFRQAVAEEELEVYNPKMGSGVRLGETEMNFYWPQEQLGEKRLWSKEPHSQILASSTVAGDLNDYSLVFEVRYKDFVALQTGDAEGQILKQAITKPLVATVLKVPHHGSRKALTGEIVKLLKPKLAVISVGEGNHFGHPAQETLEALEDFGVKILRTDERGEIEIISDGQKWQVE